MSHPDHDHEARRARVRATCTDLDVDALLVTHGVDVHWLTGLQASNAQFLLARDPSLEVLFTDGRYADPAQATGLDVRLGSWHDVFDATTFGRLGFQAEHVTVAHLAAAEEAADGTTLVATQRVVAMARRVKDDAELARLDRACAITSQGWAWLCQHAQVGMTERELARALVRHLEDLGADGPAFAPIVASGPNSAVPHHRPTDRRLASGDLLKVDFGALVDGYHADCTRTLALGEPGARLREVHEAVRLAQDAGVRAAVVGASAGDVHDASVGWLEEQDLGPTVHGVGHGVGLEIHETPILSAEPTATLDSGFVITVEPGVYLAGIGGVRIEDTLAVTADGPRRLTTAPHELVVL